MVSQSIAGNWKWTVRRIRYKSRASSLLVMAILGGAILPPVQGWVADHLRLQLSFVVPLVAYSYVAFYGWKGHAIGRGQPACEP